MLEDDCAKFANNVLDILTGLGEIQSTIWNVKFVAYKNAINNAQTVEEVQQIVINYAVQKNGDKQNPVIPIS